MFLDTLALIFSTFWLVCGLIVIVLVVIALIIVYVRSRRKRL